MKKASKYKELTTNKSLFYTMQYEKNHPVIMGRIEDAIMGAVEQGQYIVSVELHSLSDYDIRMILKVLNHYEFTASHSVVAYQNESCQNILLTIHWA